MISVLHVVAQYPTERDPQSGGFLASQIESLRRSGVEIDVCQLRGVGISKYLKGICIIRRALAEKKYQMVHAHYMYCGWSARWATTLPLVVSFMGNDVLGDVDEGGKYAFKSVIFHRVLSITLARVVSFSIAKSSQLKRLLRSSRVAVIPNGVNLQVFRPMAVTRKELGLHQTRFYVLFAGRRHDPVKRYSLAVESVATLVRNGIDAELMVLEGLPTQVVVNYMNAVDCLLMTSVHEGSPNIVKEAMACNLPIVSVDVGDVGERLTGVDNCFMVHPNASDIAEALGNIARRRERSTSAREKVKSLDVDKIVEQIMDVYRIVLKM